jgi:hypothetical protein
LKEDERIAGIEASEVEGAPEDPKKKRREFDEKSFLRKWDAENAKIDVPPPIVDDIDNDYDLLKDE